MQTKLTANIEIKHDEPLTEENISNIEYYLKPAIECIIDDGQEYEVVSLKVATDEMSNHIEGEFTEV